MIRFEEINYLGWLIMAIIVIFLVSRLIQNQLKLAKQWENDVFLSKLSSTIKSSGWSIRKVLFGIGLVVGIIGLSNPQYGYHNTEAVKSNNDIFIALDISNSMNAVDIAPNRLTKAKQYTTELITQLKGNNIGLIFFAGEAYMQMPMTFDYAAAIMMVNTADTEMAGMQGTDIGSVANLISRANKQQAKPANYLVLITDGEDHEQGGIDGIKSLTSESMKSIIVAAGTEAGGMIKLANDYKRDPVTQEPIISKINLAYINELAKAGNGKAFSVEDESSINKIVQDISNTAKSNSTMKSINEYNSYFQLFAILALLAFLIEYMISKKKYFSKIRTFNTLIGLLFLVPNIMNAQNTKDLQQGVKSYQQKKYKDAEEKFNKAKQQDKSGKATYNLGNTFYKQGKYDEASRAYEEASSNSSSPKLKAQAQYNNGNAQVQQQKYSDAVQQYKYSLKLNANDYAALNNLMKAKRDMKKQKEEQQKNQNNQNQNQQNQQNKDQNQDQNNDSPKDDQKNKEDNKNRKDQQNNPKPNQNSPQDLNKNQALQMIDREEERVQKKLKRNPNKSNAPLKDW